jgi:hypothetical protein
MPPQPFWEARAFMHTVSISGTGVFTPQEKISNAELVVAFNAYADRQNTLNAEAIARGEMEPVPHSNEDFIVKASGIESRYVLDKTGTLDPEIMHPVLRERSDEELSVMAEMALKAATIALERARLSGDRHRDPERSWHRRIRLRHERRLLVGHLRHPGRRRHDPRRLRPEDPDGQSRDMFGASRMARPRLPLHFR